MATELILDMSNPREKGLLLESVRKLEGWHRITIVKHRRRRTDRQNRYYWPCFVGPFGDYLRAQGHEFTDEMAHEVFKAMFLQTSVCDANTGQVLTYTRSSADLSTVDFNEYLDKCAAFLASDCGIVVPEPDAYHEPAEATA
jgi:hypothetical protein